MKKAYSVTKNLIKTIYINYIKKTHFGITITVKAILSS